MSDRKPTVEEIADLLTVSSDTCDGWAHEAGNYIPCNNLYHRWLAAHDREVAMKVWKRVAKNADNWVYNLECGREDCTKPWTQIFPPNVNAACAADFTFCDEHSTDEYLAEWGIGRYEA